MRKLKTSDVPVLSRCLKKLGLKEQFRELALKTDASTDRWADGFDFVWNLFDVATEKSGEMAIYEFLSGPFEMTPKEVADLDLDVLIENIKTMVRENNLGTFFDVAARLMMK